MEKKHQYFLLVFIGTLILLATVLFAVIINKTLDDPSTCIFCHEMKPYVSSYLKPEQGSAIEGHRLTCIECHSNNSLSESRNSLMNEIELSVLNRTTGIELNATFPALAVNCARCHVLDSRHPMISGITACTDCHWAHTKEKITSSSTSRVLDIPYGPHINQSCQKCHGTTFEIPRCINCHTGHGNQKLKNKLCLECHVDPHIPKKPGIRSNNTVKFTGNLPFSACQPCHENQYFNIMNTYSLHTEMQTCTLCHEFHGEKPRCSKCHKGMMIERHKDFECKTCHATYNRERFISCPDCHGTSHEWSPFTAIINPK